MSIEENFSNYEDDEEKLSLLDYESPMEHYYNTDSFHLTSKI
jgi:hypothetical protein